MIEKPEASPTINIASFPTPADDTYYFWLYYEALSKVGCRLVDTRGVSLTEKWLEENAGKIDVIHFHWPAYIYSRNRREFRDFWESLLGFVRLLQKAKSLNFAIAWTVHNLFPHEKNNIFLEYVARFFLARFSDVIFVHFKQARTAIWTRFFRFTNIHQIPHGNFLSVFPNTCSKEQARRDLGIPADGFVYLIFGPVRPYKGIEEAVASFLEVATENDILLIAGSCSDEETGRWLAETAAADRRIVPHLRFVPKEEVQLFFNAADIVLLPYKKIFTSGNLFLALTFGKPVICPDMGIISEVVDADLGVKYQPSDDNAALAAALRDIKEIDYERACEKALAKARSFTWEEAASKTERAFRQFLNK